MAEARGDRLVAVAAVYSLPELSVLLSFLRGHGIYAATVGEQHARVQWTMMVALGGVRVLVRERDLPLASELLRDIDRRPFRGPVYAPDRIVDVALMLLIAFFGVPPPARIPAEYYLAAPGPAR